MSTANLDPRKELEAALDAFEQVRPGAEEDLGRLGLVYLRWGTPPLAADLGDRVLRLLAVALKDTSERGVQRAVPLLRLAMRAGDSNRMASMFLGPIEAEELFTVAARIGGQTRCYGKVRLRAPIDDPHIRRRFESMMVYQGSGGQGHVFNPGMNVLDEVQYYIVPERGPDADPVFDFESFSVGFTYSSPPFTISFSGDRNEEVHELCRRLGRARWAAGLVPGGHVHVLPDYEVLCGDILNSDGHWDTYEYEVRVEGGVAGSGRYETKSSGDVPYLLYLGRNGCFFISVTLGGVHRLGPGGEMLSREDSVIVKR